MVASNRTIRWIENLADQEIRIHSGERASIDICATKEEVLQGETAAFLHDLYYHFDYLIQIFNSRVNQPELQLKLSRASEKLESFSLARNSMKLSFSRPQAGVLQLNCDKAIRGDVLGSSKNSVMFRGVIEASFTPFHDVEWQFLGNRVTPEQAARHYLTEFIQVSQVPGVA